MTSTVTYMTHSVDRNLIKRLFSQFANKYGKLWTMRLGDNGDWEGCAEDWLEELSSFTFEQVREAKNKALSMYRDYPPTQGQLVDLCLKESGIPDATKVLNMLVAKDFSHPIVKLVYDKIGSWKLTNGTEKEISQKVSQSYSQAMAVFKSNPKEQWAQLGEYKELQTKALPIPDKIPTNAECKSFKERMDEYYQIMEEGKAKLNGMEIPEFDKKKISKGGEKYDEYCKYLLSVPDHMVLGLPHAYAYDRQRLLNAKDTASHLRQAGYVPSEQRDAQNRPDKGRPTKIYKAWTND